MISRIQGIGAVLIVLLFLMALSCADYGNRPSPNAPNPIVSTVSFAMDLHDTLVVRCICHSAAFQLGNLNMGSFSANDMRNASGPNGPIVIPGDGISSHFYLKTTATPPFGARMPDDGLPYLSIQTQTLIRDWINEGAQDN